METFGDVGIARDGNPITFLGEHWQPLPIIQEFSRKLLFVMNDGRKALTPREVSQGVGDG